MKRVILLSLIFASFISFAQNWEVVNSGTSNQLRHVHFVNAQTGWAVGQSCCVVRYPAGWVTCIKQTVNECGLLMVWYFADEI